MATIEELKQRRSDARADFEAFKPLLDEAYDYAIPLRRNADNGVGEKRVNKAFDSTAINSAFKFAGKLQQDLWPTGQEAFKLEPGPAFEAAASKEAQDELQKVLAVISKKISAFFTDGEWDNAFHEMAIDLSAGTGAMLILPGTGNRLARFIAVPQCELLLEGGAYSDITGIFWEREWTLRAIREEWPKGNLGEMTEEFKNKPGTKIKLRQDTVWNAKKERWELTVWSEKCSNSEPIHAAKTRTCPWLTPRYFKVSGETMGRGPVMLAMPTIKTLNTAQKLTLQAAAIAMLGIFTAVDDGVFNPDNAPVEPGVFWKVARNGGVLGPSVARFPDPNIDLSNLVINEMRDGVKAALMDTALPPMTGSVRSPTEILERVKRLASDHVGAYGRLVAEIVVPVVRRVIEIAYMKRIITDAPPIDQLLVKVSVKSPMAMAREADRVQKIIQWLEMVLAILPQGSERVAKVIPALVSVGRALGVPEEFIVSEKERADLAAQEQAAIAAAAEAAAAAGAAGPPVDAPEVGARPPGPLL